MAQVKPNGAIIDTRYNISTYNVLCMAIAEAEVDDVEKDRK